MYYLGSRNPLTIIVMALFVVGGALFAKHSINSLPDVVDEVLTTAEVISVEEKTMKHRDKTGGDIVNKIGIAKLELDDGKTFTSTVFRPYPNAGERISVKVTSFSDGTKSAAALRPGQ